MGRGGLCDDRIEMNQTSLEVLDHWVLGMRSIKGVAS
jgi:hypothetical protein